MRQRWKEFGLGLLTLAAVMLSVHATQSFLKQHFPFWGAAVIAIQVLAVYAASSRWLEQRTPTEIEPPRSLRELLLGFGIGIAVFTSVMGVLWVIGVYHPTGWGHLKPLAAGLGFAIAPGVLEEVLFRGLLFRISSKIVGTWGALLWTSAYFGAGHFFNPGATWESSVAIAIEAGVLLGASYAATRGLGVPIGIHIGWNFFEGPVFGMLVSGNMTPGAITGSVSGPILLTGGGFGPEASVVAVLLCTVVGIYFLRRMIRLEYVEARLGGLEPLLHKGHRQECLCHISLSSI